MQERSVRLLKDNLNYHNKIKMTAPYPGRESKAHFFASPTHLGISPKVLKKSAFSLDLHSPSVALRDG
jgi:hypothetical protein